jgi:hypothetical protein
MLATKIENNLILIAIGLLLLYGGYVFSVLYNKYNSRELVSANWGTIAMQAVYCIIICLTLIF